MVMDRDGAPRLGAWGGIALGFLTAVVSVAIWVNNAFDGVNDGLVEVSAKLDRNQQQILKVCNNQLTSDQNLRLHILISASRQGDDPKRGERVLLPLMC